ncbi:hypothetical protein KL933_003329 [Ogataea haglerorum]|uniref:Uncharacterized protein n=1 Tax=Ogataea haglerorum TaxID=1937702 RepID=A0AAN6D4E3_9ASCO|nr:hypothetical protein KL948_005158 [Ogataea haglerorum]KAG7726398.1 hypothetical protein KL933_003329 [Ogataea haglerorum]KAG7767790.1 hypothetical protein KL931_003603 [Ogataea haglerorum]
MTVSVPDDGNFSTSSENTNTSQPKSIEPRPGSSVSSGTMSEPHGKFEFSCPVKQWDEYHKTESETRFNFVSPEFLSPKTAFSHLADLDIPKEISNYTFYSEFLLKLQFHTMNTLPFRICEDSINRDMLISAFKISPLYDFCWHAFMATSCIDLYFQQVMYGHDDVLNLNKVTYLKLGDYHFTKSMYSMSEEVKVQEDIKKSVALMITTMLHIFYATASPNQDVCSRGYFGLGRNLGLLFTDYVLLYRNDPLFNDACARYCINSWSQDASYYFPEFLYDLVNVEYPTANEPNKKRVQPLDQDLQALIIAMVDRLKKEYRAHANLTSPAEPKNTPRHIPIESVATGVSSTSSLATGENVARSFKPSYELEYDMYGTLSRYTVEVPERYIDLLDEGDPRALIITAYNIIALATKRYKYWPVSVFKKEIAVIEGKLDKLENSTLWKSWIFVAKQTLDGLESL